MAHNDSAPRPDQSIVLGTSRLYDAMSAETKRSIVDTVDDSKPTDEITENAIKVYAELFHQGGWDGSMAAKGTEKGYEYAWTGIIGMVCLTFGAGCC